MASVPFTNIFVPTGCYVSTALDLGFDSAGNDIANGANNNTFVSSNNDTLIVFNSTGGSLNLLLTSVASPTFARVTTPNPLSIAIAAGKARAFGPIKSEGWADATTGLVTMQASGAGLRAVILKPA